MRLADSLLSSSLAKHCKYYFAITVQQQVRLVLGEPTFFASYQRPLRAPISYEDEGSIWSRTLFELFVKVACKAFTFKIGQTVEDVFSLTGTALTSIYRRYLSDFVNSSLNFLCNMAFSGLDYPRPSTDASVGPQAL